MTAVDDHERTHAEHIVEVAPDGVVVVDESGCIVLVNQQLEAMFGYDRAELVGRPVEDLLPERFRAAHRQHRGGFTGHSRVRALGTGLELFGRRKDGSEFPADISLSPLELPDGHQQTIATIRDITERQQLTAQLQASLSAFQTAFEAAPVGMALVNFDDPIHRRLTNVNDALCTLLGYDREELLTKGFAELTYNEDAEVSDSSAQAAVGGELSRYGLEKRYIRKSGEPVWVWVHSAVVPNLDGAPEQVLVHVADLSERKQVALARQRTRVLEERETLAEDLHDLIIQKLFATGMGLQAIQGEVKEPVLRSRIGESVREIDETIAELRAAIFRLRPPR